MNNGCANKRRNELWGRGGGEAGSGVRAGGVRAAAAALRQSSAVRCAVRESRDGRAHNTRIPYFLAKDWLAGVQDVQKWSASILAMIDGKN